MTLEKMLLGSAAIIAPLMMATAAHAQTASTDGASAQANDIIVTAQRRSENIQDVPIAITAVGGEQLEEANVKSLQDLTSLVSGYTGPGELAFSSPHIRGVGSQISSPGLESSVALYVDGVYIGATSPALLRLSHVEQVEVLKGPQGTLFGRNTTGGLIQITTRNPGPDFQAEVEAGYASFEKVTGSAYLNVPLGEGVATNFSGQVASAGKGWGTNLATGNPTSKLDSEIAVRNKWIIDLGSNTTLKLVGDYEYHSDLNMFLARSPKGTVVAPGYVTRADGWDAEAAGDVRVRSEAWGLTGQLSHDFGFATLTNTLAYRDTDFDLVNFIANFAPAPYDDLHVFWYTQNHQWTNELQLSSNGSGPLTWTIGGFYYNAIDISDQIAEGGPAGPPFNADTRLRIRTKSISAYGQASYEVTPQLTVTLGARYSDDYHKITGGETFSPPFGFLNVTSTLEPFHESNVALRAALAYKITPYAMVYASFNKGSKSGGFSPATVNNPAFSDEGLKAYEIGGKFDFMDHAVRLNLAAFYYDYSNIQLNSFAIAGPPRIYNAASARLHGVDADLTLRPTPNLRINVSASYVHSEFVDFTNAELFAPCRATLTPLPADCTPAYAAVGAGYYLYLGDASGNELPRAPEFTWSIAANYEVPLDFGKVDLSANYAHNSGFYTSPGHEVRQPAYGRLGASIQFTTSDDDYYVRIWGSNLTNTRDTQQLNILKATPLVHLNEPRTVGITFGAKFR